MFKPLLDLAGCSLVVVIILYPSFTCESHGLLFQASYHFITEPPFANCWVGVGGMLLRFLVLGVVWFALRRRARQRDLMQRS